MSGVFSSKYAWICFLFVVGQISCWNVARLTCGVSKVSRCAGVVL